MEAVAQVSCLFRIQLTPNRRYRQLHQPSKMSLDEDEMNSD
jgi:hypothetical protein